MTSRHIRHPLARPAENRSQAPFFSFLAANRPFTLPFRGLCGEVVCVQTKPGGWFVGFGPLGCIGGLIAWLWMNRTRTHWQCRNCGLVCSLPVSSPAPLAEWAREPTAADVERQRKVNDYYHRKVVLDYVRDREDQNDYENQYYPAWYHPPALEKRGRGGPMSVAEIAQEIGEGLFDEVVSAEVMVAHVSLIVDELKTEGLIEEAGDGLIQATATDRKPLEVSVPDEICFTNGSGLRGQSSAAAARWQICNGV